MKKGQKLIKDISGMKFGMITVLEFSHTYNRRAWWICKCDCGKTFTTSRKDIAEKKNINCGCVPRINGGTGNCRTKEEQNQYRLNCIKNLSHWENTCLIWDGYIQRDTTPKMSTPNGGINVRRWLYLYYMKSIPKGYGVWNTCGNLKCINYKHTRLSKNGK